MFYSETEKQIYTSPTGQRFDPVTIQRQLILHSRGDINNHLGVFTSETHSLVEKALAEENLVDISRKTFKLLPCLETDGVTDAVAIECLFDFLEWLQGKEKRVDLPPKSQELTV